MTEEVFNRLLDRVEKPARYIGGEYNMQVKDQADLRFALCFPDVYEIGMSHLGSRILYHVLNAMDGVRCERCFAPWTDMEQALREAAFAPGKRRRGDPPCLPAAKHPCAAGAASLAA